MTSKDYLIAIEKYYDALDEIKKYNKNLIEKYPFLLPRNRWTDETAKDFDYTYTELDSMPNGWRIAFGDEMVEELSNELKKFDFEDKYRIIQIKEKYGGLRWYDGGIPVDSKIHDIVGKYEKLSYKTCISCGKPAKYVTEGWISPFCEDCIKDIEDSYHEITEEDI